MRAMKSCLVTSSARGQRSADAARLACPQIACYKICTVKVNRAVRDRTKPAASDAARTQEDRSPPKCETR